MRVQGVYFSAVGIFLPTAVSSAEAIRQGLYDQATYEATGLSGTHVAGDTPALTMAVDAARQALARSGNDISTVDSLIHAANAQQGPPGASLAGYVLRQLGGTGMHTMEISQGCNGLLGAIDVAVGLLTGAAGMTTALLTSAESFSTPLMDRWRGFGPGVIMGDGGAALVLSSAGGFAEITAMNSATYSELEQWHRGSESLLPPQSEADSRVVDMARRTFDFMATGVSLFEVIEAMSKFNVDLCRRTLDEAGLRPEDLAWVISNNADQRMLEYAFLKPLGLPMSRATYDFGRTVGHIGACDQAVSLDHLLTTDQVKPDDQILLLSTGPGMVTTCVVIKIREVPGWATEPAGTATGSVS